jgi:hypothetical protein
VVFIRLIKRSGVFLFRKNWGGEKNKRRREREREKRNPKIDALNHKSKP